MDRFLHITFHCIDRWNHILTLNTIPTLTMTLNLILILRVTGKYFTLVNINVLSASINNKLIN